MEYHKNQIVETDIIDMSDNGEGIGRINGYTLFIKDSVIGDRVRAKIIKVKKNYGFGRLEEILSPSPDRVIPPCSLCKKCGGCSLQAMAYEAQLRYKEKKVREDLIRIGGFAPELIEEVMEPVKGAENALRYRNKAQYPVGYNNIRNIISGFYMHKSHSIVPVNDCLLEPKENKIIIDILLDHFNRFKIEPYDEQTGKGLVRHILIRKGYATGEIMVCLVLNFHKGERGFSGAGGDVQFTRDPITGSPLDKDGNGRKHEAKGEYIKNQKELIDKLREVEGIRSISVNINNEKTNVILGRETATIWGSKVIRDVLMDLEFEISPESFYQVNPVQTEKLYGLVKEYAGLTGKEEVWDICCGIGTIALMLASGAKAVHGIEIVPQAIENAKRNAFLNNIANSEFICAPAEEFLPIYKDTIRADVVIMDPPRKGMDEKSLEAVLAIRPPRIIYVSCDPATLARDLKYLCSYGYELVKAWPVDMFPQTGHVETVCLLSQRKPDTTIEVDLDISELEVSSAETKATYEEIKSYVLKKFGLKVSNLYIAQVKRECGIVERINYNLPKTEGNRVPQCPEDKRKAIKDAFIHFQMI